MIEHSRSLILLMSILLLSTVSVLASDRNDQYSIDSLMNEGIDLSRQGRFDESNTIFLHLLNDSRISENHTSIVYSELIANALHVGDYKSVYKFLVSKNG